MTRLRHPPFSLITGGKKLPITEIRPDGEEPKSLASAKAVADFTEVLERTGLIDQLRK